MRRQVPRGGAAVQARAVHPRGRAGPRPPRRRQAAQQPRAAVPEPGTAYGKLLFKQHMGAFGDNT